MKTNRLAYSFCSIFKNNFQSDRPKEFQYNQNMSFQKSFRWITFIPFVVFAMIFTPIESNEPTQGVSLGVSNFAAEFYEVNQIFSSNKVTTEFDRRLVSHFIDRIPAMCQIKARKRDNFPIIDGNFIGTIIASG